MFKTFNIYSHKIQALDFFAKSKHSQCFAPEVPLAISAKIIPIYLKLLEFSLGLNSEITEIQIPCVGQSLEVFKLIHFKD